MPEKKLIKKSNAKSNDPQQQHIENLKIEQHQTLAKQGLNPLIQKSRKKNAKHDQTTADGNLGPEKSM